MCEIYGGYTLETALELPSVQLTFLWLRIKDIWYRRTFPFAQLQAFVANALGGKGGKGKKTPEWKLFKSWEFLPHYAMPDELREAMPRLEAHHCYLLQQALENKQLESWMLQKILMDDDLDRIVSVAEQYAQVLAEEQEQAVR